MSLCSPLTTLPIPRILHRLFLLVHDQVSNPNIYACSVHQEPSRRPRQSAANVHDCGSLFISCVDSEGVRLEVGLFVAAARTVLTAISETIAAV